jgi:WD40 repeat protein
VVRVLTLPDRPTARPAFSPDGRQALTGHDDGSVYLWDLETGQEVRRLEAGPGPINVLAFAPDGRRILTGHYDGARLWHLQNGRLLRRLRAKGSRVLGWGPAVSKADRQRLPKLGITAVAFSPRGRRAVTGDSDGLLFLWDSKTGRKLRSLVGHTARISDVAFSPDGRRILSCSAPHISRYTKPPYDQSARLWDAASGRELRLWKRKEFFPRLIRVAFAAGGRQVMAANLYGTVWVWDARSGRELRRFAGPLRRIDFPPYEVPDMCEVALFAGGRRALWVILRIGNQAQDMRLFDVASGRTLHVGRLGPPRDAVGSPDGRRLLTTGDDGKLWLWELPAPP